MSCPVGPAAPDLRVAANLSAARPPLPYRRGGKAVGGVAAVGLAVVGLAALLALAGCQAYQLGNAGLYRADIRTIHVDIFTSDSYRKFLGQRLTEAVVQQLEVETPYRFANPGNADSFLRGKIIRERKRVLAETVNDDPRTLQLDYLVEFTWTDRNGIPLMPRQVLRLDRSIDFIPESGQSRTTAEQELMNRLARQIVGHMEMPW